MALPLPALQNGAAGLQVSLSAGGSGPAPIQGSLQFLDPYSGNWQQVGSSSIVGGGGGPLHFDVPAGIPEALPLRLVVTTDAGMFMHLDQMSYSEYQTKLIEDREVSRGQGSAFAGAVNLDLAPMPEAATLETGQTYANLSVPNDVAVPMGVAFSLPALGSNESGVQMQFSGESSGETSVVASLQGFINGSWREVTSGVVMGSGSFFLDAPVLSAGTQLKLVVQSGSAKFVNVSNMDYKTVTKAVQSYVSYSCDSDNVWNGNYRWSFNGKERVDEVAGKNNWQDYGLRQYDTRLARFPTVDPLTSKYPMLTPFQFAGNNPIKYIDLDGAEPANNPTTPGVKEVAAVAQVGTIALAAEMHHLKENKGAAGSLGANPDLKGTNFCTGQSGYRSDNTQESVAKNLNTFVGNSTTFHVDESQAKEYENYEAFVVYRLLTNFVNGVGPENYEFSTNGLVSSQFRTSHIVSKAIAAWNAGEHKNGATIQYGFGPSEMANDAADNGTLFNITGLTGSGSITLTQTAEGLRVRIFNVTSLSSGSLTKLPNYETTFPKSYVRDQNEVTPYGNISQTYNLLIPWRQDTR